MKAIQVFKFIVALAVCFGASGLGAMFMANDYVTNWYAQLQKPSITPPDWVFGPAWTILYFLMSISLFLVWNKGLDYPKVKLAIGLFLIQLALNAIWTPIFFGIHSILLALIDIVLLFIAILVNLLVFKSISTPASILLVPYLLWVGYPDKAKGINEIGQHDNLYLIPEDLSKRKLVDVLKSRKSWDQEAQAVIIAEGLLMYLSPSAVHDLFRQCASITGAGSRIAFTYIGKGADGRPDAGRCTGFLLWTLKVTGEPWLWCIQPDQIGDVLEENGWTFSPELAGRISKRGVEYFGVARKYNEK